MREFTKKEILTIARVCHAANKAFSAEHNDFTQRDWYDVDDEMKASYCKGVEENLNKKLTPRQHHEQWMETKIKDGWKWGKVKNEFIKEHPSIVPYDDLPFSEKQKDRLFAAIVEALTDDTI